jgi:transglutaminase-like putative cysteine protease
MQTIDISHETRYGYAAPVSQAQHLAHLQPLSDPWQHLLEFSLQIQPPPAQRCAGFDPMGNQQLFFCLNQPHRALQVHSRSRVRVAARFDEMAPAASPPWDGLRDSLGYEAGARYDPAVEFVQPSPYVPRLEGLREYGAASFTPGRPVAEGGIELMRRVHRDFRFETASTEIDTPLDVSFAQRRGVCQDFAHLTIGMLRMQGLPARYVSGYLLTIPPPGQAPLVGADASHAWVQLYCPGTPGVPGGWLDLDPTNDLVPGTGHVRLAVGRDFGDVTPLRGVIRGGGRHSLDVAVMTRVLP